MVQIHNRFVRNELASSTPEDMGRGLVARLTETSISPRTIEDLGLSIATDLKLDHTRYKGLGRLCDQIAKQSGVDTEAILTTVRASMGIYIVQTALLTHKDHLVIQRPNYPPNLDGPQSIGCEISYLDLKFSEKWALKLDRVTAAIQPNTKLISITNSSNPTGTCMTKQELQDLADLAKARGCFLLVDETYSEMVHDSKPIHAATLGPHVIAVSSISKAYGVSGLRVGWIATTNEELQELFMGFKDILNISLSVVDETLAAQILEKAPELFKPTIADIKKRTEIVDAWIQSENLEWVKPTAGCLGLVHMKKEPPGGTAAFYKSLLNKHKVQLAEGGWFEQPDTFFRLGFAQPTEKALKEGLAAISRALRE